MIPRPRLLVVGSLVPLAMVAACTGSSSDPGSAGPSPLPATAAPTATSPTAVATTVAEGIAESRRLTIVDGHFQLDGNIINGGAQAEGLLMNSRMIQAIIDIEGETAVFSYPDTGTWDPERNTNEFVENLPLYASYGLNAVTIGLQGGNPLDAPVQDRPPWRISSFAPDGSLDPSWLARLDRVLAATNEHGITVILSLFYFGQDHHLRDEAAVVRAVDEVVDWLMVSDYHHVLVEICNECNLHYDHDILHPNRVGELVGRVRSRSEARFPVSASLSGGVVPDDSLVAVVDFVLLHGNNQPADRVREMVEEVRLSPSFLSRPKPILFNEDSVDLDNLRAAVFMGAGWGYYDKGTNNYRDGFQAPPVNWSINTREKADFFTTVGEVTGTLNG